MDIEMLGYVAERQSGCEEPYDKVFEEIDRILNFSNIARKEGLLSLETAASDMFFNGEITYDPVMPGVIGADRILARGVMLVVDGTDSDFVERILTNAIYMNGYTGRELLAALVCMEGVLAVQAGANPHIIEEMLLSLLPDENQIEYREMRKKREEEKEAKEIEKISIPDEFFQDEAKEGLVITYALSEILSTLDNRAVQRLLRDVENRDIALSMKAMSGAGRKAIMSNLSSRLATMIYEDIEYMGCVRERDVEEASRKIISIIRKLEDAGEIVLTPGASLKNAEESIARYEHGILQKNREIDFEINRLKRDIERLEASKVMIF